MNRDASITADCADTITMGNLNQSSRDAAFGLFSLPSLRSLKLWRVDLDKSFYTGMADAAPLSQVGDWSWQTEDYMHKK